MNNAKKYLMYVVMGLTTFVFIAAGGAKLAGVPEVHVSFGLMGLPAWFGYFIGACEVAGAIGIWLKKVSAYAAGGLLIISAGAAYFHIAYEAFPNSIHAIVLSVFCLLILMKGLKARASA